MMNSRVDSTRVIGKAIEASTEPPKTWLQMSTATIYADRRVGAHDEATGVIGGEEPDVPLYWEYSVRIARRWEETQAEADTPRTRKVALRSAMVMTPDQGGIFDVLSLLTRIGLGGPVAGGGQRMSWIHGEDFVGSVAFLLDQDHISGPVNIASPDPVPQAEFMRSLRSAWNVAFGLPATKLMADVGAWIMRSDPELLLKSRSVVPGRLLEEGFEFLHPTWDAAALDLAEQMRCRPEGISRIGTLRTLY